MLDGVNAGDKVSFTADKACSVHSGNEIETQKSGRTLADPVMTALQALAPLSFGSGATYTSMWRASTVPSGAMERSSMTGAPSVSKRQTKLLVFPFAVVMTNLTVVARHVGPPGLRADRNDTVEGFSMDRCAQVGADCRMISQHAEGRGEGSDTAGQ